LFAKSFEDLGASARGDEFLAEIRKLAYYFMGLGVAAFVFMSGQATFLETAAGIMTHSFKTQWFDALLRQDMAYYDIKDVSGTATIISNNGAKYKKGLGRKLGAGLQFFVTFLGGLVYAFYASWRISLIILTTVPFLMGSTLFLLKTNQTQSARASEGYAEAGSIVQMTVSSIRTILSLNAVKTVIEKYSAATEKAYRQSIKLLHLIGAANGTMMASMVLGYVAVALYGSYLLYDNVTKTGCDPSGGVPSNESCDPDGADVFGSLMGITFAATVLPQVQVGVEALTGRRRRTSRNYTVAYLSDISHAIC
jgi:ATP-binding cassette subfamily B (MDR/TAP) protein 1